MVGHNNSMDSQIGQNVVRLDDVALRVLATDRGVLAVEFEGVQQESGAGNPGNAASCYAAEAAEQLRAYFSGELCTFTVPVDLSRVTTPFQRRVLQAMARIPYGQTWSYAKLAAEAGSPRAIRAAASACANNPLAILYPCHRVVRSDGHIGKYLGGAELKQALIDMERRHCA